MSPMLTLAANQWVVGGLVVLGILASLAMILTILIQRPQGGGLAAAFGGAGAGSGQTAFGAKTGDALTIMTIIVFIFWLLVSIGLVYATKRPDPNAPGAAQTAPAEGDPGTVDPDAPPAPPEVPAAGSMDPARPPEATETPAGDVPPVVPETGTPATTPPGTTESTGDGAAKSADDGAKTDEGGGR